MASRLTRILLLTGCLLAALATARAQTTSTTYLFTHLAGPLGGPGNADGYNQNARFKYPETMAADRAGSIYVTDRDNHSIRRIYSTGLVTTLKAPDGTVLHFQNPSGIAVVDNAGTLVVSDASKDLIYRITPAGVVSTLAGTSHPHYNNQTGKFSSVTLGESVDANGTDARFFGPMGLAADNAGNIYVADAYNRTIRKITPTGDVTTIAGSPTLGAGGGTVTYRDFPALINSVDGTGPAAQFSQPAALALDGSGNLYVTDAIDGTVRKITPAGDVTTLAGTAGQRDNVDGTGATARFYALVGVATNSAGNIYVTDNDTVRQITPMGVVTTIAGAAGQEGSVDGPGATARFNNPAGLVFDSSGHLYVADPGNFTIRKLPVGGGVTTYAAEAGGPGQVDGTGTAARFHFPQGVALDRAGNLIVADFYNHAIRKVTPTGIVTTVASAADSPYGTALLYYPSGVAVDANGNTFVANAGNNSVLKVTPDGVVSTFAGPPDPHSYIFGSTDGTGTDARFAYPEGIAIDNAGNLYVADSGNNTIRKITPAGVVSTLAGTPGAASYADGTGPAARFSSPLALAADSAGNVYVADTYNTLIRKITPGGVVTTLAGSVRGYADGVGPAARFSNPCGIAVDGAGNVFVGDADNLLIRKITPDGTVTTVGGQELVIGSADGLGLAATFFYPSALAVDAAGSLYVADEYNHAIRKGLLAGPPVITTQPLSQTVAPGGTVQLSVVAASVLNVRYQWYINGSSFSGATASTLSFANARSTDAGEYTVVVTNDLGSVISNQATLAVAAAPVTPPAPPASASGGGAIGGWFAVALLGLGVVRVARAVRQK